MSSPQDIWRQLQQRAAEARRTSGRLPRGIGGAGSAVFMLGGAAWALNQSLFNVDGGHRAIKYTRIGGVGKEIYSEGKKLKFKQVSSFG